MLWSHPAQINTPTPPHNPEGRCCSISFSVNVMDDWGLSYLLRLLPERECVSDTFSSDTHTVQQRLEKKKMNYDLPRLPRVSKMYGHQQWTERGFRFPENISSE